MPELPEVEAVARMFAPLVGGRKIRACRVLHPIVVSRAAPGGASGARALSRVRGRRVLRIERRGKYLLLRLDRGWLMIHFRLDGQLVWYARGRRPRHIDVEWEFARGTLGFVDRRHLGRVRWLNRLEDHPGIARLGIDPLSSAFGARRLQAVLEGSRRAIKRLLMDQTRIAGLGKHLDLRIAVAGRDRSPAAGQLDRPRRNAAAGQGHCCGCAACARILHRFRAGRRQSGMVVRGRGQDGAGVRARGAAVPAVRGADPKNQAGRPVNLLLPRLPAECMRDSPKGNPKFGRGPAWR